MNSVNIAIKAIIRDVIASPSLSVILTLNEVMFKHEGEESPGVQDRLREAISIYQLFVPRNDLKSVNRAPSPSRREHLEPVSTDYRKRDCSAPESDSPQTI